ncbi:hypothetical protein KIW84_024463 [Lathyrus oleraceus]|uniref:MULE transposase domain-containing protein n=1 Tax=Pisum sativum TaxID=3888 RepID=A0A9D5BCU0_PEA|nr:hypothetical protein KIW84_024463 [Pisum sativum]
MGFIKGKGVVEGYAARQYATIWRYATELKRFYAGNTAKINVGRDLDEQYFPLTIGFVETKTKESWRWFLQLLMEDIRQERRYVFISDQYKGLLLLKRKRKRSRYYAKKAKVTTDAIEVPFTTGAVEVPLAISGTDGTAEDGDGTLTQETTALLCCD